MMTSKILMLLSSGLALSAVAWAPPMTPAQFDRLDAAQQVKYLNSRECARSAV